MANGNKNDGKQNNSNDGGSSGGGNDQMQQLMSTVQGLADTVGSMQTNMNALAEQVAGNNPRGGAGGGRNSSDGGSDNDGRMEVPEIDEDSLERLSRRDLLELAENRAYARIYNERVLPLQKSLDQQSTETFADKLRTRLREVSSKPENKDFAEWGKEIKHYLTNNPQMDVEDALILARSKNPDKAQQLAEKHGMVKSDDSNANNADGQGGAAGKGGQGGDANKSGQKGQAGNRNGQGGSNSQNREGASSDGDGNQAGGFGGMAPGGGGGEEERNTRMSIADATSKAWDDVTARHEGIEDILT